MENIIIIIIFSITLYVILFNDKKVENMSAGDPRKPEKCFYDYELLRSHGVFVDAVDKDINLLKRLKGKLLPIVCILELVANRKNGWDRYLDSESNKKGGIGRKAALTQNLKANFDKVKDFAMDNGLEFLMKPYKMMVTTLDDKGTETKVEKEVNVIKDFEEIIIKKLDTIDYG